MRSTRMFAALILAAAPAIAPGQGVAPRPQAAWANSGSDASAPPAVIATTNPGKATLPADARLPLPDDGLRLTPAQPTTTSAAARPPGLMPNLPGRPNAGRVQQAVYVPPNDTREVIQQVAAPPIQPNLETGAVRPGSLLSLEVIGPPTCAPGQNMPCQIVVRNAGSLVVGGVQIDLPVPPGMRLGASKPEGQRESDRVVWHIGNLEAGGERRIDVEVQVSSPCDLQLGPTARFTAAMAYRSAVTRPPFSLTVSNPESATVGEKIVFHIQIGNHTGETIRRIGLRCELSAGLVHEQGQVIEADLGEDLAPGQTRTIQLQAQASQPGRQSAALLATADGNHSAKNNAGLLVGETTLGLTPQGPRQAALGSDVTLGLEVHNPGPRPVGPVRVTQMLPQGLEYISAGQGGMFNPIIGSVTWTLPEVGGNQKQPLTCQVRARQPGDWALASSLQAEGMAAVRTTHAVSIEATPAVSLEITPMDDPLPEGRDTIYEMRVYNAGPGSARGLRVVVSVPDVLVPVAAEGPSRWQIRGQDVYFEPLAEMRGREDAMYKLRVRGAKPGQGPFRVEVHAAGLPKPQKQELTSHVQGVSR